MRSFRCLIALLAAIAVLVGCSQGPATRRPPSISVAAIMYPGGGAPPSILALYKAALEVSKTATDFDLKITTVSPTMPDQNPMGLSDTPPTVAALEQAMGQDPPPDIVIFASPYEFGPALDKDLLQPIDGYLRGDKSAKPEDYFPGALESVTDQGRLYGLPVSVGPTVMMYDKRAFDEVGAQPPESNWNWSTFLGLARQLTRVTGDPQKDQYALSLMGPNILPAFIWQNGGEVISKDGKRALLTEPAALEAIRFYSDLMFTYKVVPPSPRGSAGVAKAVAPAVMRGSGGPNEMPPLMAPGGRVAMQYSGGMGGGLVFGLGPFGSRGADRPFHLIELPRGKVPATILDVQTILAMTARASNPSIAYKAMASLAAEMQKDLPVPAQRAAAKNLRQMSPNVLEEDVQVLLNSLEYARALPVARQNVVTRVLYQKLLQPLQDGTKTPTEAAKEASDAIDEELNK